MNVNDPFGYPNAGDAGSEPEETPGVSTGQPGEEDGARQSGATAPQSFEEVCAMLLQTGIVENSFKQEMNQYRVETRVERNNRRWSSRVHVLLNGEKMSEAGFLPDTRRIDAEQGIESDAKWEQFVQDSAHKHLEKCKQVQQHIAESSEGSGTDSLGKKIGKILLLLLVALSLLLNIIGGYLYFERNTLKNLMGLSDSAPLAAPDMPVLRLEYATIRGNVHEENGLPTITLTKTDMVTVNVVNQATGEVLHSGLMNINLAQ